MRIWGRILAVALIVALLLGGMAMAEEQDEAAERAELEENAGVLLPYATLGECFGAPEYTGRQMGTEEVCTVVLLMNGQYVRAVAEMDDEARRLHNAITDGDVADIETAFAAYDAYVAELPVAYTEVITAQPVPQEELDALVGRTLAEVQEAGYESSEVNGSEGSEAEYVLVKGMYAYSLILNEPYETCMEYSENGREGELTVKSARLAGPSNYMADPLWHADGTVEEIQDGWTQFNSIMDIVTDALSSGKDKETVIQELTELMPDQADEIRTVVEMFAMFMGGAPQE